MSLSIKNKSFGNCLLGLVKRVSNLAHSDYGIFHFTYCLGTQCAVENSVHLCSQGIAKHQT